MVSEVRRSSMARLHAAALAVLLVAASALGVDLQRDIDRILARNGLEGASIGISVVDLATGRQLAQVDPYEPRIPASNMKLFTSAASVLALDPVFAFETKFVRDGDLLVIVGAGDPGLGDPVLLADRAGPKDVDGLVDTIAAKIAVADDGPIREIVIADGIFDGEVVHPSWPAEQLQNYYCAEVRGLNFHLNIVNVFAGPTTINQPGRIAVEPDASGVEIQNVTSTVASRTAAGRPHRSAIAIRRDDAANRLRVSGSLSRSVSARVSVYDAATLFAEMIAEGLEREGVQVGQPGRLAIDAVRRASPGERPTGAVVHRERTTLAEALDRCNRDSYNLYAEALLKRLGHELTREPGSFGHGAAAVRSLLVDALGPSAVQELRVADGSGMSRDNAVAPATIVALLAHMNDLPDEDRRDLFLASLARPGEGTLRRNFPRDRDLDNRIAAKSGYLNGVRTLSGYVLPGRSGQPVLAFSIMMNDFKRTDAIRSRDLRNELVTLLDRYVSNELAEGNLVAETRDP
ncbi:MAG: D-alanyl-D-alanine carboxypeptidase/D-alanyl-D-alanine-endopeptidase [Planctomycetota bacterium]